MILILLFLYSFYLNNFVFLHSLDLNGFTSKTAYRNSKLSGLNESLEEFNNCKLVHINALFRHGTRFPGSKDIKKINVIHKKFMSSKGSNNIPLQFVNWKVPFSLEENKLLSSVGYEEMSNLGYRFKNKLDNIDGFKDYLNHIKVISSSLSRAKVSAITFMKNFLGKDYPDNEVLKLISEDDKLLRYFDNCPRYSESVSRMKSSKNEYKDFLNGSEIKQVIRDIQLKWNLTDIEITPDDVRTLYVMCGFEIATNMSNTMKSPHCSVPSTDTTTDDCPHEPMLELLESSPLCSVFDPTHFAIFEYLLDLKHYWVKSYGSDINWLQSCILMSSIVDDLSRAAKGHQAAVKVSALSRRNLEFHLDRENYPRAVFMFGHAETLLPLISLVNLFNQSHPMTSGEYKERLSAISDHGRRFSTFRVSNIAPFSGNVALDLYHCPYLARGHVSGYRVQVRSNEKTVPWPLANVSGGSSHVALETFLAHFRLCHPDRYRSEEVCGLT